LREYQLLAAAAPVLTPKTWAGSSEKSRADVSSPRTEFLAGARAEVPILFGAAPFGLIYGVLATSAGLPPAVAMAMSSVVFAGSAQFIAAGLIGGGAPGLVLVLTTFVVNLRHMLYSASLAPHLRRLSPLWKALLAYLLTDEAYVIAALNYERRTDPANKHWYFLGAGLALWTTWQTASAVGIFLGAQVPASWGLDFTLALTFIGLVMPALRDRADTSAALAAGLTAVLAAGLPLKLGLFLAAAVGITAGLLVEEIWPAKRTRGTVSGALEGLTADGAAPPETND
jgi:4-azaleucine resistance transporter AzlC